MNDETPMNQPTQPTEPEPTDQLEQAAMPRSAETIQATQTPPGVQAHESPWHPVHISHLVMGLAFLGLVAVWVLVVPLDAVDLHKTRWLLPLPWLVAGAAGLVATVLSGRRRRAGR